MIGYKNLNYFTFSDAWIITALLISCRNMNRLDMYDLIAEADKLNSAIPMKREVLTAFEKAASKGIIGYRDNKAVFGENAERIRETVEATQIMTGSYFNAQEKVLDMLNALEPGVEYPFAAGEIEILFNNAVSAYKTKPVNVVKMRQAG